MSIGINQVNNTRNSYNQTINFKANTPKLNKSTLNDIGDSFIKSTKENKGLIAGLIAGVTGLFAKSKIDTNNTVDDAVSNSTDYESYTIPTSIKIPEENSVTLPNGEKLNMKKMFEEQGSDCWSGGGSLKNVTIIDPNMSMKELKKYIPEMKYNEYSKKWEIPCPGFGGTKIDLQAANVLRTTEPPTRNNPNGSHELRKMSHIFGEVIIPKQSVEDGNIRQLDFDKIDKIYNENFEYYSQTPKKFIFVKEGTTIKNEDEITTINEDSVIVYPNVYVNEKNISVMPVKMFIADYKPTINETSKKQYETIKDSVRDNFELTSPKGRKFNIDKSTYSIDGIRFEKIKNLRDGGSMDGYYWDYVKMNGEDLDELYDKYYSEAKNRSAQIVMYNVDNGEVQII